MAIDRARLLLARVFTQRCFYLFVALLALITVAPFVLESERGRVVLTMLDVFVLLSAVAAVGRHVSSFVVGVTMAIAIMLLQFFGVRQGVDDFLVGAWALSVLFYLTAVIYLLGYVMRRDVLTMDKLWAGASVYLMLGVMWAFAYALVQARHPGVFAVGGTAVPGCRGRRPRLFQLHRAHEHRVRRHVSVASGGARAGHAGADRRHAVRRHLHRAAHRRVSGTSSRRRCMSRARRAALAPTRVSDRRARGARMLPPRPISVRSRRVARSASLQRDAGRQQRVRLGVALHVRVHVRTRRQHAEPVRLRMVEAGADQRRGDAPSAEGGRNFGVVEPQRVAFALVVGAAEEAVDDDLEALGGLVVDDGKADLRLRSWSGSRKRWLGEGIARVRSHRPRTLHPGRVGGLGHAGSRVGAEAHARSRCASAVSVAVTSTTSMTVPNGKLASTPVSAAVRNSSTVTSPRGAIHTRRSTAWLSQQPSAARSGWRRSSPRSPGSAPRRASRPWR